MKFLVDENVKLRLAKLLISAGHDVKLAAKGSSDKEFSLLAQKESRIILTHDSDFANSALFPPEKFSGIILLRVAPPIFSNLARSLESLLRKFNAASDFKGKLITLFDEFSFWVEE